MTSSSYTIDEKILKSSSLEHNNFGEVIDFELFTAQAAAGQEGATVTSSFVNGVVFYQITDRGLMVAADISGTRFWVPESLN